MPKKVSSPSNGSTSLLTRLVILGAGLVLLSSAALFVLATADHATTDQLINKVIRSPASSGRR